MIKGILKGRPKVKNKREEKPKIKMNEKAYTLLLDKHFVRDYRKLDKSLQIEGDKKLKRLKENPKEIGKPLKFFPNLYELHLRMYRIYYVIEESEVKVLVLAIEHKDEQDKYLRSLSLEKIRHLIDENR